MATIRNQSEGLDIRLPDGNGTLQPAAHASYNIRNGQGFNLNLDVFTADLVAANLEAVKADVNAFINEALTKAAENGMPVDAP